jgi:hypothetical protein
MCHKRKSILKAIMMALLEIIQSLKVAGTSRLLAPR